MRILFCSYNKITKDLGAPKVIFELSEELEKIGWHCSFISPNDLLTREEIELKGETFRRLYTKKIKNYLINCSHNYDVIDYDHQYLPFSRKLFSKYTLFVARSVLLIHHFKNIKLPMTKGIVSFKKNIRSKIKSKIFSYFYEKQLIQQINFATKTCIKADLVNVANYLDKSELIKYGIYEKNIVVLPFGFNNKRRILFDKILSELPLKPKVVFIGTFDNRKGATDFPLIFKIIEEEIPEIKFSLLGVSGLYRTKEEVLSHFPKNLHSQIEIVERYKPETLPKLLEDCSVGIFPSYVEGFPFGVLEMLAASIPVIAYDSPGPPMMLPPKYLVPPGDINGMSKKVVSLLNDKVELKSARLWARKQSQKFNWTEIANKTSQIYLQHLDKIRMQRYSME